jgi:hypothetical protein
LKHMVYLILAANLLILTLVARFVMRLWRASPDKRKEMLRPRKRTVLIFAGLFVAVFLVISTAMISFFGFTGIRAGWAARAYLREQFGARDRWGIQLTHHVVRSKKPQAGVYQANYRYGERKGILEVEYFERDGKLVFKITPKD